jgi:hypothetical protein
VGIHLRRAVIEVAQKLLHGADLVAMSSRCGRLAGIPDGE